MKNKHTVREQGMIKGSLVVTIGLLLGLGAMARAEESKSKPEKTKDTQSDGAKESFVDTATPKNVQPEGAKGRWVLTFSDEFNAGTLNASKWRTPTVKRQNGNHGVEWGWDATNVHMGKSAGHLVIETRKEGENTFRSGCVNSRGLFEQRYGFFEARIKAPPKNNGHQAAFWLMPADGQMGVDKPGAEIDVVETHLADEKATSTLHWNGYKKGEHRSVSKTWKGPGLHEGFHTYGVEWTPKWIRVYYDGQPVWTHEGKGIPQVEEYLICSVGILNWAAGDIRKASLPQRTLFDWVRVYSRHPKDTEQ